MIHLPPTRKILCALGALLVVATALPAIAPGARAAARRPTIEDATVSQAGRDLVLTVRTAKPEALAALRPRPDTRRATAAYLCFGFAAVKGSAATASSDATGTAGAAVADGGASVGITETRLCLGGPKAHKRAGLVTVDSAEKPLTRASLPARLKRPQPDELVLSIVAGPDHPSGLVPGHYRWRVLAAGGGCKVRRHCTTTWPPSGPRALRLRPVRAVGCTGGNAELVGSAATERKVVALTFDDGPSEYTERFLDVLREKEVPATFFEIGQEMPGREATMRRILAEGDEIGDHTMNHVEYPGHGQIAGAAQRIKAYTGFQPCLFRPPGGAVNSTVVATAGSLGMKTIIWDVDPRDWSLPGTSAIYSNIVNNARPGSIILMHDGGGPRDETLTALPEIIDTLRARGYGFETVSELLGNKMLYRPYH
ncbi:MAG: polysaccharide deacetylase family protein [Actinobacteria bacterium]|nr:polysaccharide deacetylase family protein [Actinomycetota bacterium]